MLERTGLRNHQSGRPLLDRVAAYVDKKVFGGKIEKLGAQIAFGGMVPAKYGPFIPSIHLAEANSAHGGAAAGPKPVDDITAAQDRISVAMNKESGLAFQLSEKMDQRDALKFRMKRALLGSAGFSFLATFGGGIAISGLFAAGTSAAAIVGFPLIVYTGLGMGILRLVHAVSKNRANKAVIAAQETVTKAQEEVFAGAENPIVLEALARELAGAAEPSRNRLVNAFVFLKPDIKGLGQRVAMLLDEKDQAEAKRAAEAEQAKYDALPLKQRLETGSWQQLATLLGSFKTDLAADKNPWPDADDLELEKVANWLGAVNIDLKDVARKGQLDPTQTIVEQDISDLQAVIAGRIAEMRASLAGNA